MKTLEELQQQKSSHRVAIVARDCTPGDGGCYVLGKIMNVLLWTLVFCGVWNAINFIARIYYNEPSMRYSWHIIVGIWAAILLFW